MKMMKNSAFVGNTGHSDNEIDLAANSSRHAVLASRGTRTTWHRILRAQATLFPRCSQSQLMWLM